MTDWSMLIEPVARELLGEPNPVLSRRSGGELRYGRRGSLSVCISPHRRAGQWFDHEAGEGGGLLALVERERGGGRAEALGWLETNGFLVVQERRLSARTLAPRSPCLSTASPSDSALEAQRTALASRLWQRAIPPEQTPARTYLSQRLAWPPDGIGPDLPPTVRWLPSSRIPRRNPEANWYGLPSGAGGAVLFAWHSPESASNAVPAAVSLLAVTANSERIRWFKADGPKMYAVGSRRGLVFTARASEGGVVHITEGEVDGLALTCQRVEGTVRATGGTSGLGIEAAADPAARPVVLYPDGDRGGFVAAAKAQVRILATGRECRIAWREPGSGDPADDLAVAVRERAAIRADAGEAAASALAGAWCDLMDSEAEP